MNTRNKKQNWLLPKKIFVVFLVFIFVLFIQLIHLSLFPHIYGINMKEFSLNRNTHSNTIYATRGSIFDTDGNSLAINVTSYTVIAYLSETRTGSSPVPLHVTDPEYTAYKLAPILKMSVEDLTSLMSKDLYQVELGPGGRGITELTKQEIETLELPGIDFIEDQKRYYPNGDFASYIIGYAKKNDDGSLIGEMGIETKYDEILKGTDGYEEYQQDLNGYKIPDTKETRTNPINGNNIYLTIDANIQRFLEQAVKNNSKKYEPEWMLMAVMHAKTGDVLGSASTPSFDPNIKNITNYENPLSSYLFEPGSTMKIYTYMCAMEKGVYDGTTMYDSGKYVIGEHTVKDWNSGYGWGRINYDLGFEYSSNVAIANILNTVLTKNDLKECFKKYGFEDATGIELGRELYRDFTFNYDIEVANAGFGQGILTTPIQHLQGLTLLSNNGHMLKPHIVSKIVDPNTETVVYERQIEEVTSISQETVNKIKDLMFNVVNANNEGTTGTRYKVDGLDVIGKTGTAQIYDDQNGGYLTGVNDYIYSFSGMYPKDNPEIIIYAAIKKPNFANTMSLSDSVVEVIKNISKYKNINTKSATETSNIKEYKLDNYLNKDVNEVINTLKEQNINTIKIGDGNLITSFYPEHTVLSCDRVILITNSNNYLMPNMTSWSKREVKYLLDYLNVKYKFNGNGYVANQNIKENTPINSDAEIEIEFKNKENKT